jgi:hypothetical protein
MRWAHAFRWISHAGLLQTSGVEDSPDSHCRLIKTDRFEFLIVVLLAGLKYAMQICGKLPAQESFVDKFAIKETDGALAFARIRLIVCSKANTP